MRQETVAPICATTLRIHMWVKRCKFLKGVAETERRWPDTGCATLFAEVSSIKSSTALSTFAIWNFRFEIGCDSFVDAETR